MKRGAPSRMRLWVLLPAYNEAESLPLLLERFNAALGESVEAYRIVVVDDGSNDGTGQVAASFAERLGLELIEHKANRGLARAIDTGLRYVLSHAQPEDIVVTMDADNTHPPELISQMLKAIQAGADLVIASRYAPGGVEEGVPRLRKVLSASVGWLMRVRFRLDVVRDYSCGFRAYRAVLLQLAAQRYGDRLIESHGFTVMAELLVKLQPLKPKIVEIPLHLRYDLKRGPSKLRVARTIREYFRLLFSTSTHLLSPGRRV